MGDPARTAAGTARQAAPARSEGDDILDRAVAILTQETSFGDRSPRPAVSPGGTPGAPALAGLPPGIEPLRQRAIDAVTALLAAAGATASAPVEALTIPWRKAGGPARPGDGATVPLTIENAGDLPVALGFYSTDLIGDTGYRIPAHLISFDPPTQVIPPHSKATSRMNVAVPLQAMAGAYSALVQAVGLAAAKAVVTLDVI